MALFFYNFHSTGGGCDVLERDLNGTLKIEELHIGDTFGEMSFELGKTPHTVITNQHTEMLMIIPSEIESYLETLKQIEYNDMYKFISNWPPAVYWNWCEEHFKMFINNSKYIRFNKCDIIYGNSNKSSNKIYFILKGKVELIRLLKIPKKFYKHLYMKQTNYRFHNKEIQIEENNEDKFDFINKFYRVCTLEENNYFGIDDELSIDTWYVAKEDVNIAFISFHDFQNLHYYAEFLFEKLKDDFKFWIPTVEQEFICEKDNFLWKKFVKSIEKSIKKRE